MRYLEQFANADKFGFRVNAVNKGHAWVESVVTNACLQLVPLTVSGLFFVLCVVRKFLFFP